METILEILSELHPDVDFENCASLIDGGILDSFDIVSIITQLSDKFDVSVTADKILPENFNSAAAIFALVNSLEDE